MEISLSVSTIVPLIRVRFCVQSPYPMWCPFFKPHMSAAIEAAFTRDEASHLHSNQTPPRRWSFQWSTRTNTVNPAANPVVLVQSHESTTYWAPHPVPPEMRNLPHLDSSYHVSDFKHLSSKAIQGFNVSTYFGSLPDSGEASTHTTDLETLNAHWNAQQYCNFKRALIQSANSKENLHFQCHALSEKKFRHWNQTGFFVISFPFPVSMSFSDFHKLSCVLCVYFFNKD